MKFTVTVAAMVIEKRPPRSWSMVVTEAGNSPINIFMEVSGWEIIEVNGGCSSTPRLMTKEGTLQ